MVKITEPGIYDLSEEEYHSDPCPEPSLSSSLAKVLINQSPRHAWAEHPRLNPDHEAKHKAHFDIGSLGHELLVGGPGIVVIDQPDFKTKAARELRDKAYEEGKTPVKRADYDNALIMNRALRGQLIHHPDTKGFFDGGETEKTLIWREGDIWCRCKLDWYQPGNSIFPDYKTDGGSVSPTEWQKKLYRFGYHIQDAFYRRGITAVLGVKYPEFRFVAQETSFPYAMGVFAVDDAGKEIAERDVNYAIYMFGQCLRHDNWPGYVKETAYLNPPAWIGYDHENRLVAHDNAIANNTPPSKYMLHWQSPDKEQT